jgi:hypothetical protein
MTITRKKVTLNECLANIDVIRKHVMLSGKNQHKAQTADMRHRTKVVLKITRARSIHLFHVLSLYDKTDLAALEGVIFSLNFIVKASSENVIFLVDFFFDEFIETTYLVVASVLLSTIPRLYNSPKGERKIPKYMSLFFL